MAPSTSTYMSRTRSVVRVSGGPPRWSSHLSTAFCAAAAKLSCDLPVTTGSMDLGSVDTGYLPFLTPWPILRRRGVVGQQLPDRSHVALRVVGRARTIQIAGGRMRAGLEIGRIRRLGQGDSLSCGSSIAGRPRERDTPHDLVDDVRLVRGLLRQGRVVPCRLVGAGGRQRVGEEGGNCRPHAGDAHLSKRLRSPAQDGDGLVGLTGQKLDVGGDQRADPDPKAHAELFVQVTGPPLQASTRVEVAANGGQPGKRAGDRRLERFVGRLVLEQRLTPA